MVDARAAKLAALVAGSALFVLVVGTVLRWITRLLAWALFVALIVLLAYAAYELYAGWTAVGESEATAVERTADPLDSLQNEYVSGG